MDRDGLNVQLLSYLESRPILSLERSINDAQGCSAGSSGFDIYLGTTPLLAAIYFEDPSLLKISITRFAASFPRQTSSRRTSEFRNRPPANFRLSVDLEPARSVVDPLRDHWKHFYHRTSISISTWFSERKP